MLKDEQDCSRNGGVNASPLKTWSEISTMRYVYMFNRWWGRSIRVFFTNHHQSTGPTDFHHGERNYG